MVGSLAHANLLLNISLLLLLAGHIPPFYVLIKKERIDRSWMYQQIVLSDMHFSVTLPVFRFQWLLIMYEKSCLADNTNSISDFINRCHSIYSGDHFCTEKDSISLFFIVSSELLLLSNYMWKETSLLVSFSWPMFLNYYWPPNLDEKLNFPLIVT